MNRTIKEATVKRFYYETHDQLREHLANLIAAYNFSQATEDPQGSHVLRIHLQMLDKRATAVHFKPAPSNTGTKHLMSAPVE